MRAGDVMTRRIVTIAPEAPVEEAARLMLRHRVSGLPVVDGSAKLLGILTEGDLLRRLEIGTGRQRPRWLTLLLGDGLVAEDYVRSRARTVGRGNDARRRRYHRGDTDQPGGGSHGTPPHQALAGAEAPTAGRDRQPRQSHSRLGRLGQSASFCAILGPGLITGASDDDPSGIVAYAQAGAH